MRVIELPNGDVHSTPLICVFFSNLSTGCLRYKVDFQCMQLDEEDNDFDFDDY